MSSFGHNSQGEEFIAAVDACVGYAQEWACQQLGTEEKRLRNAIPSLLNYLLLVDSSRNGVAVIIPVTPNDLTRLQREFQSNGHKDSSSLIKWIT